MGRERQLEEVRREKKWKKERRLRGEGEKENDLGARIFRFIPNIHLSLACL